MEISAVKTPPVQQTQSNKRAEEARLAQSEAAITKAQEVKKSPEPQPKPVVNTQGQSIGGRLNVVA